MNVCLDDLTVGQVKELVKIAGENACTDHPYKVGKNYFIRTVTFYYTGRLVRVLANELVLEEVAWIADTGRFSDALVSGDFSEVEPFQAGEIIIGRGSIVDASEWQKPLPRTQK